MPSLSCLSIFEPGQFGSDSGNVIIPTAEVPFPISAFVTAKSFGSSFSYAVVDFLVDLPGAAYGSSSAHAVGKSTAAGVGRAYGSSVVKAGGDDGSEDSELLLLLL